MIPELGRSPGRGNGNPLQYSCLENPMDRGSLWAIVHGIAKSWTKRNIHAYNKQNLEHLETELAIKKKKTASTYK